MEKSRRFWSKLENIGTKIFSWGQNHEEFGWDFKNYIKAMLMFKQNKEDLLKNTGPYYIDQIKDSFDHNFHDLTRSDFN